MKRTKAGGRVVKSCSPFSAAKWQRQKSRRSRGQSGDFLRSKKYYSALDGLDSRNGDRTGLFSMGRCAILELVWRNSLMDCIEFESKIPKDILEIVCKLGKELHIHPLSSLESENYFYGVLSNFQGKKEELIAYLSEQIKKDFKFLTEMPEWLQESDWQFHNGKPMCFVGQIEVKINQGSYIHSLMFYVFWDTDTGITKTIIQSE